MKASSNHPFRFKKLQKIFSSSFTSMANRSLFISPLERVNDNFDLLLTHQRLDSNIFFLYKKSPNIHSCKKYSLPSRESLRYHHLPSVFLSHTTIRNISYNKLTTNPSRFLYAPEREMLPNSTQTSISSCVLLREKYYPTQPKFQSLPLYSRKRNVTQPNPNLNLFLYTPERERQMLPNPNPSFFLQPSERKILPNPT